MQDRRLERRFDLQLPCLINVPEKPRENELCRMETINISRSGAYVTTSNPLSIGTMVEIDLFVRLDAQACDHLPGSCITVAGRVLRSDPDGMALMFAGPYQINRIDTLIAMNRTKNQWLEHLSQPSPDQSAPLQWHKRSLPGRATKPPSPRMTADHY